MSSPVPDLTSITPTLCALLGIEPPALAKSPPFAEVLAAKQAAIGDKAVERLLIFAPDALGRWLMQKHGGQYQIAFDRAAPVKVELESVLPTVTPVCFSSIFTGAYPEQHGIQKYERPLQRTDSFFDALVRAGKSCAIVAVVDCSMDIIFRERAIDYFTMPDDRAVREQADTLIKEGRHDVIVAYQPGYDDMLHATVPESPECLAALALHMASFGHLCDSARLHWGAGAGPRRYAHYLSEEDRRAQDSPFRPRDWAVCFIPDHGSHIDPETGHGTHGSDLPEDMELTHWWGIHRAVKL